MQTLTLNKSIVEATELPKIIQIKNNLYAIAFSLMKLLPARYIIEKAIDYGLIKPDTVIIESSSGTFAKGLAIICNLKGLKLIIVGDKAIDTTLQLQLEDLGAKVEIVEDSENKGIQYARLQKLEELKVMYPNHYWPCQYHNTWNSESYSMVANLALNEIHRIDFMVGPVGSGGSMSGILETLRKHDNTYGIAVDTHGSVLFGQNNGNRVLRGLGNSLIPQNLHHAFFDEIHWVTAEQAFLATRLLHQQFALFMGPTSGASFMVGNYYASQFPHKNVCVVLPDEGWRYPDVYNNAYLKANGLYIDKLPDAPKMINLPENANNKEWNFMNWNRRLLSDI